MSVTLTALNRVICIVDGESSTTAMLLTPCTLISSIASFTGALAAHDSTAVRKLSDGSVNEWRELERNRFSGALFCACAWKNESRARSETKPMNSDSGSVGFGASERIRT